MPANIQWWNALEAIAVFMFWAVGTWTVVTNAWWRKLNRDEIPETDIQPTPIGIVEEYPEGLEEAHGDPPLALKLFIGIFVFWMIGYVIMYFLSPG